jgi:hypothetical protein
MWPCPFDVIGGRSYQTVAMFSVVEPDGRNIEFDSVHLFHVYYDILTEQASVLSKTTEMTSVESGDQSNNTNTTM